MEADLDRGCGRFGLTGRDARRRATTLQKGGEQFLQQSMVGSREQRPAERKRPATRTGSSTSTLTGRRRFRKTADVADVRLGRWS
ncbi:hypothetical protein Csa_016980 [Cucumis sativus]|uniref:Uncharacterized protein n=1 Tax=Cucumis sativus TaxID=3659 RepID=A0A0A0KC04_CUCSA|nr:hypothetical protein Csa_016980 [Cucumis sativus]